MLSNPTRAPDIKTSARPLAPLPRSVFAFGIVAWEVAAQARAYADTLATIEDVRTHGRRPDVARVPPDFPPAFATMLERVWVAEPSDRPSIYKVLRELNRMNAGIEAAARAAQFGVPSGAAGGASAADGAESATRAPRAPSARLSERTENGEAPPPPAPVLPLEEPDPVPNAAAVGSIDSAASGMAAPGVATVVPSAGADRTATADAAASLRHLSEDSLPPPPPPPSEDALPAQAAMDGAAASAADATGTALAHEPALPSYESDSDDNSGDARPSAAAPVRLIDESGRELPRRQLRANLTLPSGVGDPGLASLPPLLSTPSKEPLASGSDGAFVAELRTERTRRGSDVAPLGLDKSLAAQVNAFGVVSLCNLLRTYEAHRGVVLGVGRRLRALLTSAAECSNCVGARGAAAILAALSTHREDDEAVEAMCLALQLLAVPPEGKAAVVRARGIEALVGTLRRLVSNARIAQICCRAISHLLYESAPNAAAAGTAGAADLFVLAMATHPQHGGIVRAAARGLAHLVALHPPSRTRAVNEGAVQQVIAALTGLAADPHVVAALCSVLGELATGASLASALLLRFGGVVPLAAAAAQHADEADVAVPALTMLARLCDGAAATQTVTAAGATLSAQLVLAALPSDEAAVSAACACLGRIAALEGTPVQLTDTGVKALVAVIARWPASQAVVGGACATLRSALCLPQAHLQTVSAPPASAAAILAAAVASGGFVALSAVVDGGRHSAAPTLIVDVCSLLVALLDAMGDSAGAALASAAALRVAAGISAALARRPSEDLVFWACTLLLRLASAAPSPDARNAIAVAARAAESALVRSEGGAAGSPPTAAAPPAAAARVALVAEALSLIASAAPPPPVEAPPPRPPVLVPVTRPAGSQPSPFPTLTPARRNSATGAWDVGEAGAAAVSAESTAAGASPSPAATAPQTPVQKKRKKKDRKSGSGGGDAPAAATAAAGRVGAARRSLEVEEIPPAAASATTGKGCCSVQ